MHKCSVAAFCNRHGKGNYEVLKRKGRKKGKRNQSGSRIVMHIAVFFAACKRGTGSGGNRDGDFCQHTCQRGPEQPDTGKRVKR